MGNHVYVYLSASVAMTEPGVELPTRRTRRRRELLLYADWLTIMTIMRDFFLIIEFQWSSTVKTHHKLMGPRLMRNPLYFTAIECETNCASGVANCIIALLKGVFINFELLWYPISYLIIIQLSKKKTLFIHSILTSPCNY